MAKQQQQKKKKKKATAATAKATEKTTKKKLNDKSNKNQSQTATKKKKKTKVGDPNYTPDATSSQKTTKSSTNTKESRWRSNRDRKVDLVNHIAASRSTSEKVKTVCMTSSASSYLSSINFELPPVPSSQGSSVYTSHPSEDNSYLSNWRRDVAKMDIPSTHDCVQSKAVDLCSNTFLLAGTGKAEVSPPSTVLNHALDEDNANIWLTPHPTLPRAVTIAFTPEFRKVNGNSTVDNLYGVYEFSLIDGPIGKWTGVKSRAPTKPAYKMLAHKSIDTLELEFNIDKQTLSYKKSNGHKQNLTVTVPKNIVLLESQSLALLTHTVQNKIRTKSTAGKSIRGVDMSSDEECKSWDCPKCNTKNAASRKRCQGCLGWREGAYTKGATSVIKGLYEEDGTSLSSGDEGEKVVELTRKAVLEKVAEKKNWKLRGLVPLPDMLSTFPLQCMGKGCGLTACCVWSSTKDPTRPWFCCLDCQVARFGGFPKLLPFDKLGIDHYKAMMKMCTNPNHYKMPKMPFPESRKVEYYIVHNTWTGRDESRMDIVERDDADSDYDMEDDMEHLCVGYFSSW